MTTYRIIPAHRGYRVEAVQPNGQRRVVRTWSTEDDAISHLKVLQEMIERANCHAHPGEKDWRG